MPATLSRADHVEHVAHVAHRGRVASGWRRSFAAWIALALGGAPACGPAPAKLAPPLAYGVGGGGDGGSGGGSDDGQTPLCSTGNTGGASPIGAPSTTFPPLPPNMPQVASSGGAVLSAPNAQAVFFAGEDPATMASLGGFLAGLGTIQLNGAPYWSATTQEYGVGPLTARAPILLVESAPAAIADSAIKAWLAGKLDNDDPAFPKADENTLFVLYYPESTTITLDTPGSSPDVTSCTVFGGYHSSTKLDAAHGGFDVPYAVLPRCPKAIPGAGVVDITMMTTSHEMIEAATDPHPFTAPAFFHTDGAHLAWEAALGGGEVADLCVGTDNFIVETPTAWAQRTWSNAAAAAGHDPCVPAPPGEVFFNSIPVLPDTLLVPMTPPVTAVTASVVSIPAGQSKTIELDLFSDADTGAPWSVSAAQLPSGTSANASSDLAFCLDALQGQNGQKLHLTITVSPASMAGVEVFAIVSTLGQTTNLSFGLVTN